MRLFACRPLGAACALFFLGLFSAYFLPFSYGIALCLICGFFALFFLLRGILRGFSYRRLYLFLALLGLALGCTRTLCEQRKSEAIWDNRYERAVAMEFSVREILYSSAYSSELLVDVCEIDGEKVHARAVLRSEAQLPFYTEDRACGTLLLKALDFEAYSEASIYQYRAKGAQALLILEDTSLLTLSQSGTNQLRTRLLDLRAVLSHRISYAAEGEEGKLLAAMLLGSKQLLADQTKRDFKLSGVSHLLALSGLHLVILAGLIERFLYLLGAGRKLRIAMLLLLCFFYLMLTGCNYSLLRAMIMLGFVYVSALFHEDHDSLTSLLLAGAVILAFTPYAIFSVSFQMTMLATFGILAFIRMQSLLGTRLPKGRRRVGRLAWRFVRFLCSSLMISISTTVMLLPVLCLEIGAYSLMTPLANLLLVPIAPFILFSALLTLLLPFSFVGAVASVPASLALRLSAWMGSAQAMISLNEKYVPFLVISAILLTMLLLIVDLKRLYPLAILPAAACMIAFVVAFFIVGNDHTLSVVYRQSGKNEGLVLVRGAQAMICDISGTTLTQLRADWREAQENGATELSVLLLTHYHSKSATAVSRFAQDVILRELWLPTPETQAQGDMLAALLGVALKHGIRVTLYDSNTELTVFDTGKISVSEGIYRSRSMEPAFSLTLSYGNDTICYHSASYAEYLAAKERTHACTAAHLILGAHGPVPKQISDISNTMPQSILVGNEEHLGFFKLEAQGKLLVAPPVFVYELE